MIKTENPKSSWRDVITIHPAADLFPMMSPDELKALGKDIQTNGLLSRITLFVPRESTADFERALEQKQWAQRLDLVYLLDGRNRLTALELQGVEVVDESGALNPALATGCVEIVFEDWQHPDAKDRFDPYSHAVSRNLRRRHLSAAQKRNLITAMLKAQPSKSNRTIAQQAMADHKTVGAVRDRLEGRGEIPHAPTVRSADNIDAKVGAKVREIMARDAATPGYAKAVMAGIAAKLDDLPELLKREPTAPDAHA